MKLAFAIGLAAICLGTTGCFLGGQGLHHSVSVNSDGAEGTKGSGKMKTKTFKVADFTKIRLQVPMKVTLEEGDTSVEFTCDDNLIDLFKAESSNGEFSLRTDSSMNMSQLPTLVIRARNMTRVEAGSATTVDLRSGLAKKLEIELNGAAQGTVSGSFDAVNAALSGASKLTMTGSAVNFVGEATGASTIEAEKLSVGEATIEVSGASNALVNVKSKLTAKANGASSVHYTKEPSTLIQDASQASTIGLK